MAVDRYTWLGLFIAGLGWLVLVMGQPMAEVALSILGRPQPAGLKLDTESLSQSMIVTGFGIAIVASLHNGFGALNRFFAAILQRTAASAKAKPVGPAAPPRKTPPIQVAGRGRIEDRSYTLFSDGSVEVETLLGARRFSSFEEAREFIGA